VTNETFIEDLRLVPLPNWWENPWAWVGIAVVAAVAIYFLRRWFKSQPPPLKKPLGQVGPAAHVVALQRLAELRARHPQLTAYDVALECSDILRRFIESRFQSAIRFQTTREFLGAAQRIEELNDASRADLARFLEFFDAIKFAQENASHAQTSEAIDAAEQFVRRSIPTETLPVT